MAKKKCPPPGAAEWVVTYGDMMSLLLTFFIMLFAMSTLEQVKVEAVSESLGLQFGYATTQVPAPGPQRPAQSNKREVKSTGRAKRKDTLSGGNPVISPQGDYARLRTVRPDQEEVQGGIIYFELGSDELTDAAKRELRMVAEQLRGSPFKVILKGHTSIESGIYENNLYALAFARAMKVREELIRQGVNGRLLHAYAVGPDEPVPPTLRTSGLSGEQANAFVEVLRLMETDADYNDGRTESL